MEPEWRKIRLAISSAGAAFWASVYLSPKAVTKGRLAYHQICRGIVHRMGNQTRGLDGPEVFYNMMV